MTSVNLCFQVHQPFRLNNFQPNGFELSQSTFNNYFNYGLDKLVFDRVTNRCYLPTNSAILELIDKFKSERKKFKVTYSVTGTFLEMCEMFNKDVLDSFKQLSETGCVEFLGETYFHSLASLFENKEEFVDQVRSHFQIVKDLLGFRPSVFVNTEMIYNNVIAKTVEDLGFKAIFTEGTEKILGWRSPNFVYKRKYGFPDETSPEKRIKVLLRNYRLSDDIGYRFSAKDWNEWPLTADKFSSWVSATPGQCINLFIDYETFGEHQWAESGIFWFLKSLPQAILKYDNLEFTTPSETVKKHETVGEVDVFEFSTISWADIERDVSAWLGNNMQRICFEELKHMEPVVRSLNNPELLKIWRLLQVSDHSYYCCTKWMGDGDVHKYFSSFNTPQDAYANYISVISDFKTKLFAEVLKQNYPK
jgi:alpha-amylase